MVRQFFVLVITVFIFFGVEINGEETKSVKSGRINNEFVGRLMEKGRTLVHNTFKRFMILLPAIFFKLGIAFTMLVLVTIVSVNNGFIGFLLLVVGLSSVLARLQDTRKTPPLIPYPVVQPTRYIQDWDRKDKTDASSASYPQLGAYYNYYKQNYL